MSEQIKIEGLGYRHPINEVDQIMWFMEKYIERYIPKRMKTRFWLDFWEQNHDKLYRLEAFELIDFLKTKITEKQIEDRVKYRLQNELKLQLQMSQWKDEVKDIKRREELKKTINLN